MSEVRPPGAGPYLRPGSVPFACLVDLPWEFPQEIPLVSVELAIEPSKDLIDGVAFRLVHLDRYVVHVAPLLS